MRRRLNERAPGRRERDEGTEYEHLAPVSRAAAWRIGNGDLQDLQLGGYPCKAVRYSPVAEFMDPGDENMALTMCRKWAPGPSEIG